MTVGFSLLPLQILSRDAPFAPHQRPTATLRLLFACMIFW
jgi:hypothetical protein